MDVINCPFRLRKNLKLVKNIHIAHYSKKKNGLLSTTETSFVLVITDDRLLFANLSGVANTCRDRTKQRGGLFHTFIIHLGPKITRYRFLFTYARSLGTAVAMTMKYLELKQ